jgi:putative tricarboxylic transport membrane protein
MRTLFIGTILAGALALPLSAADYTIMAPAAPGGGWDQTARTMQAVMQDEGVSSSCRSPTCPAPAARSASRSSSTRPAATRAS